MHRRRWELFSLLKLQRFLAFLGLKKRCKLRDGSILEHFAISIIVMRNTESAKSVKNILGLVDARIMQ